MTLNLLNKKLKYSALNSFKYLIENYTRSQIYE